MRLGAGLGVLVLLASAAFLWFTPEDEAPQKRAQFAVAANPPPMRAASAGESDLTVRLSALYRQHAEILEAHAKGDDDRAADLLDEALGEAAQLMQEHGREGGPRVQSLLRVLVDEHEVMHGTPPDTVGVPGGEIYALRDSLFASLDEVEQPMLTEMGPADAQALATEVPLPMNRLVQGAVSYLLREPENHLYRWMHRSSTYFPMIEHIFAQENVPDELKYLALVESGLNMKARSWASAAGPWQFIPATGRAYGLEINEWVDERLDPVKSTKAAAAHLKDLHALFGGDWHLALAGYNCSPTVIREAMRKARRKLGREPTYWDIYADIPAETRNYVPTFVAAALVVSNPEAYGARRPLPGVRFAFDKVPVQGMMPIETVADLAGTTPERIRALNPELRQDRLPPGDEPYYVRIPYGSYDQFSDGYEELGAAERGAVIAHGVRSGETLDQIARQYEISVARLMEINSLTRGTLRRGEKLYVPDPEGSSAIQQELIAESAPYRVRYGARTVRPVLADGEVPEEGLDREIRLYEVRPGDTLSEIADEYDVRVADLRRWNSLRSTALQVGQRIKIYG